MKANDLLTDLGKHMDAELENMKDAVDQEFSLLAPRVKKNTPLPTAEEIIEMVDREDARTASGFNAPMAKP